MKKLIVFLVVILFASPLYAWGPPAAKLSLLNLAPRTAPAAPANGDMWTTTAGVYARINGATVGPIGLLSGMGGLGTGVGTWLATPSSVNLAAAVTDETGTGALVFGTGPTLQGPAIVSSEIAGHVGLILTAAQVSSTVIYNTGQGPNDINHTLPTPAAGYFFTAQVGESQAAKYWRFTAASASTMCLNGTCDKNYVSYAAPTRGDQLECRTIKMADTGIVSSAALTFGGTATNVFSTTFGFDIAGTGYSKAAVAAGTPLAAGTIPQNTWGIYKYSIIANGTIASTAAAANFTTGYASEALAIAALPATPAVSAYMGYVAVMSTAVGGFVGGTSNLNDAGVTANYLSASNYTKPYHWNCRTITGTVTTN